MCDAGRDEVSTCFPISLHSECYIAGINIVKFEVVSKSVLLRERGQVMGQDLFVLREAARESRA